MWETVKQKQEMSLATVLFKWSKVCYLKNIYYKFAAHALDQKGSLGQEMLVTEKIKKEFEQCCSNATTLTKSTRRKKKKKH